MAFVKFSGNSPFRPDIKPEKQDKKAKVKKIKPISDKREKEESIYRVNRKIFLAKPENESCFIEGCRRRSNTIEHRKGRKGFADDWARDNGISLLLDERFWAPCCIQHNLELESNSELSKKYQLSKLHNGTK